MWQRRMLELLGEAIVGDGVNVIVAPKGHMRLWRDVLPWQWWHALADWGAAHPDWLRVIGFLQVIGGAWLCRRASRDLE